MFSDSFQSRGDDKPCRMLCGYNTASGPPARGWSACFECPGQLSVGPIHIQSQFSRWVALLGLLNQSCRIFLRLVNTAAAHAVKGALTSLHAHRNDSLICPSSLCPLQLNACSAHGWLICRTVSTKSNLHPFQGVILFSWQPRCPVSKSAHVGSDLWGPTSLLGTC